MITSKIDEIRLKLALEQEKKENKNIDFLNSVYDLKKSVNSTRTDSLDYNNIKGITLEEIETLFKDTENRQLAKKTYALQHCFQMMIDYQKLCMM